MIRYPSAAWILEDWRGMLDFAAEAGDVPLLDLGMSAHSLDGLVGLAVLRTLSLSSQSSLTPVFVSIGGPSTLWLWILVSTDVGADSNATTVVFTGIDPALHMASLTTLTGRAGRSATRSPKVSATGLPAAIRWLVLPQSEPSTIFSWQAWPLSLLLNSTPDPTISSAGRGTVVDDQEQVEEFWKADNWLTGSAFVLCILLLIVALL